MAKKPSLVTAHRDPHTGAWTGHPDAVQDAEQADAAAKARRQRWPQTAEGFVDTRAAMTTLARSFPTLRAARGIDPFDVETFVRWMATSGEPGSGAVYAGRFVLSVWNSSADWREVARDLLPKEDPGFLAERFGRFDLFEAAAVWDHDHRLACMIWLEAPFYP
jgi:hypothetical protein